MNCVSAIIGNRSAFNSEKTPYLIVVYKRHAHDECEPIYEKKYTHLGYTKHEPTTTSEHHASE